MNFVSALLMIAASFCGVDLTFSKSHNGLAHQDTAAIMRVVLAGPELERPTLYCVEPLYGPPPFTRIMEQLADPNGDLAGVSKAELKKFLRELVPDWSSSDGVQVKTEISHFLTVAFQIAVERDFEIIREITRSTSKSNLAKLRKRWRLDEGPKTEWLANGQTLRADGSHCTRLQVSAPVMVRDVAFVAVSSTTGPLDGFGRIYALRRSAAKWSIVASYQDWVS